MPLLLIVLDKLMIIFLVELLLLLGIKLRQYKKLMILLVVFPNNDIHFSRVSDPSNFDVDPDPDLGNHIWEKCIRILIPYFCHSMFVLTNHYT